MILSCVLVSLVAFLLYYLYKEPQWENMPPGPIGLPILGSLLDLLIYEPTLYYARLTEKFGPICSVRFGRRRVVLISSAPWLRKAFVNKGNIFSARPNGIPLFYITRGKGIAMSEEAVNFHARKVFVGSLKQFGYGKNDIEAMIDIELESYMQTLEKKQLKRYNPRHDLSISLLNVTWHMLSGETFQRDSQTMKWLVKTIGTTLELVKQGGIISYTFIPQIFALTLTPKAFKVFLSVLARFRIFRKSISSHHKQIDDMARNHDFIFSFLQEQKRFSYDSTMKKIYSDTQLAWILSDIFVAAMETSTTSIRWALIMAVEHTDVQNLIHKKIEEVLGSNKPSLADRERMPYIEAFISEVLRAYSSIPIIMHATSADTSLGGFNIPKGTWIVVNIHGILNDKEVWGDPENFRPSRFINEDGKYVKSEHHIPFSVGRRNCIGEPLAIAELFLFLTNIFQKFYVRRYDSSKPWNTGIKYGLTLVPYEQDFMFVPK